MDTVCDIGYTPKMKHSTLLFLVFSACGPLPETTGVGSTSGGGTTGGTTTGGTTGGTTTGGTTGGTTGQPSCLFIPGSHFVAGTYAPVQASTVVSDTCTPNKLPCLALTQSDSLLIQGAEPAWTAQTALLSGTPRQLTLNNNTAAVTATFFEQTETSYPTRATASWSLTGAWQTDPCRYTVSILSTYTITGNPPTTCQCTVQGVWQHL